MADVIAFEEPTSRVDAGCWRWVNTGRSRRTISSVPSCRLRWHRGCGGPAGCLAFDVRGPVLFISSFEAP